MIGGYRKAPIVVQSLKFRLYEAFAGIFSVELTSLENWFSATLSPLECSGVYSPSPWGEGVGG